MMAIRYNVLLMFPSIRQASNEQGQKQGREKNVYKRHSSLFSFLPLHSAPVPRYNKTHKACKPNFFLQGSKIISHCELVERARNCNDNKAIKKAKRASAQSGWALTAHIQPTIRGKIVERLPFCRAKTCFMENNTGLAEK